MMTVRDLIDQFTIEGALRVQTCVDDDGKYDIYFETKNIQSFWYCESLTVF